VLEPLYDDPAGQLPAVVQELARYWQAAIEPVWQRVRGLCSADVAYRMEQFANGGVAQVLGDLHPDLGFSGELLLVDKPHHCSHRFDLAGAGIVLAPCAFTWPSLIVGCCGVDQPVLIYPPRGVAELWEGTVAEQPDPLSALVGRTRANLLGILALPSTTTQLAERLDLSPAAVSQHLKILKDAGLVTAHRRGRMVLYQRTPADRGLIRCGRAGPPVGPGSTPTPRPGVEDSAPTESLTASSVQETLSLQSTEPGLHEISPGLVGDRGDQPGVEIVQHALPEAGPTGRRLSMNHHVLDRRLLSTMAARSVLSDGAAPALILVG
jgi:DNA-binding transcriptional ArsR family regulator